MDKFTPEKRSKIMSAIHYDGTMEYRRCGRSGVRMSAPSFASANNCGILTLLTVLAFLDCSAVTIHRSFSPRGVGFGGGAGAVVPVESRIAAAIDEGRAKEAERPRVYVGRVTSVMSGDELCLVTGGGTRVPVRLDRIDAPELDQPYGRESAAGLKKLVHGREVRVQYTKCDRQGRVLGLVTLNKTDVNLKLVAEGLARYCGLPDRTPGYAEADAAARTGKKGLWAGER